MSKLTLITPKEMIKLIQSLGFTKIRQNGSHIFFSNGKGRSTVIPLHNKDMRRGLIKSVLSDIGLSAEEYEKIIRGELL